MNRFENIVAKGEILLQRRQKACVCGKGFIKDLTILVHILKIHNQKAGSGKLGEHLVFIHEHK